MIAIRTAALLLTSLVAGFTSSQAQTPGLGDGFSGRDMNSEHIQERIQALIDE